MVQPGDVLLGDADGVAVIPRHLAAEVAQAAAARDRLEGYILERVQSGQSLPGLYPPGERTLLEYESWRQR